MFFPLHARDCSSRQQHLIIAESQHRCIAFGSSGKLGDAARLLISQETMSLYLLKQVNDYSIQLVLWRTFSWTWTVKKVPKASARLLPLSLFLAIGDEDAFTYCDLS